MLQPKQANGKNTLLALTGIMKTSTYKDQHINLKIANMIADLSLFRVTKSGLSTMIATMRCKTKKNKGTDREVDITMRLLPLVMKSTKQLTSSWSKCS